MVAQGWLVYQLTGSSLFLGTVALARAVPVFICTLLAGAIADRYDRRTIMMVANGVVAVLATTLGLLTLTGWVEVWHVVLIAFIQGTAFSFEVPSRQSLIADVVEPRDVVSAVGLNSVAFNTAGVIGPAIAGILIAAIGEGPIFMLNGATYLTVVLAAWLLRAPRRSAPTTGSLLASVVDGLRYVRRTPALFSLVLLMTLVSLLARPYINLLPVFAADILSVGPSGLGALNSAVGVGAVAASAAASLLGRYRKRGLVLMISSVFFGLGLVVLASTSDYTLALTVAVVLGFVSAFTGINSNMMMQSHADPRMRGRVVSLHGLQMMGVNPVGVMLEGAIGSVVGVPLVLMVAGAATALASVFAIFTARQTRELD